MSASLDCRRGRDIAPIGPRLQGRRLPPLLHARLGGGFGSMALSGGDTPRLAPDYLPSASSAIHIDAMGTAADARNAVSEWPLKLDVLF
jgi:hypothetical protein